MERPAKPLPFVILDVQASRLDSQFNRFHDAIRFR